VKCSSSDAQDGGSAAFVAVIPVQHMANVPSLQLGQGGQLCADQSSQQCSLPLWCRWIAVVTYARRQVLRLDHSTMTEGHCPLHRILEFPNVAGEWVPHQHSPRAVTQIAAITAHTGSIMAEEVVSQETQIVLSLPQRGHYNGE